MDAERHKTNNQPIRHLELVTTNFKMYCIPINLPIHTVTIV